MNYDKGQSTWNNGDKRLINLRRSLTFTKFT